MLRFITPRSFRLVRARLVIAGLGLLVIGSAGLSALGTGAAYASTTGYKVASTSGLNERTAPSTASGVVGTLANGTTVDIACQAGGVVYATGGSPSSDGIWDQLTNGRFVADYWVNTPGRGAFSSGIPRCGIAQVSVWNTDFPQGQVQVCGTNQVNGSSCTPVYSDPEGANTYDPDYWFKGPVTVWAGGGGVFLGVPGCAVPAGYSSSVYTCKI